MPPGSKVIAGVGIKTDSDADYGTDGSAIVDDSGKWLVEMDTPTAPEFAKEPHVAQASWTPVNEKDEVTALTGLSGEKLKGRRIWKIFDGKYLGFRAEKTVNLKTRPKTYALPPLSKYASNTPEGAVVHVLWDWKRHDWSHMSRSVHDVLDSSITNRLELCKAHFDFWEVKGAKIISVDITGNIAKVVVHVQATLGSELKEEDQRWIVLRLNGANNPSEAGTWGVNIEAVGPK